MTNLFLGDGSDCIVKLIDEDATGTHAPGYQQLVRGEPMPDINNTFLRGHRLVVQVQSSSFPLAAVNPQAFAPNVGATPDAVVKATELVFHEPSAASSLALQVLRR
jgi:predicted acyl esterase